MNAFFPPIPLGTLAANLLGGYLVGIAMGLFAATATLSYEWRLFAVTGFLGGLTTFSTFSAEVVALLQAHRYGWVSVAILGHVAGSLVATFLGFATFRWYVAH